MRRNDLKGVTGPDIVAGQVDGIAIGGLALIGNMRNAHDKRCALTGFMVRVDDHLGWAEGNSLFDLIGLVTQNDDHLVQAGTQGGINRMGKKAKRFTPSLEVV